MTTHARPASASARSASSTRRAVSGASSTPFRPWPVAHTSPSSSPAPIDGRVVGRHWAQPCARRHQLELRHLGQHLVRGLEQAEDAVGRHRRVEALLLRGRPDHHAAVGAGHHVAARRADHAKRGRSVAAATHAQLQQLALHGTHRRGRRLPPPARPGRSRRPPPRAPCEPRSARRVDVRTPATAASLVSRPETSAPASSSPPASLSAASSAAHHRTRVRVAVLRGQDRAGDPRREPRLQRPGRARGRATRSRARARAGRRAAAAAPRRRRGRRPPPARPVSE